MDAVYAVINSLVQTKSVDRVLRPISTQVVKLVSLVLVKLEWNW